MSGVHDKCYLKTIVVGINAHPAQIAPFGGCIAPAKGQYAYLVSSFRVHMSGKTIEISL